MNSVQTYYLSNLELEPLFKYCSEISKLVTETLGDKLDGMLDDFNDACAQLCSAIRKDTDKMNAVVYHADAMADKAWSQMYNQTHLNLAHFDINVCRAADYIMRILAKYGNPTQLPYEAEYNALSHLLNELRSVDANILRMAGIDGWAAELNRRVSQFYVIMNDRIKSKTLLNLENTKQARQKVESEYRVLISRINGRAAVNDDPCYAALISAINSLIQGKRGEVKSAQDVESADEIMPEK